jgi:serine protease Do
MNTARILSRAAAAFLGALALSAAVAGSPSDLPRCAGSRQERLAPPEQRLGLVLVARTARQGLGLIDAGLYVKAVSGPARRAGLRIGDAILAVNDVSVAGTAAFDAALQSAEQGDTVVLRVRRGEAICVVPVEQPASQAAGPA